MMVRYLGHSSFLLQSLKTTTVVTDPYATNLPYQFPNINADVVVISHEHRDHNAAWRVNGPPTVIKRTSDFQVEFELPIKRTNETLVLTGLPTFHDKFSGRRHGPNTIWHWYMDGIHLVHLGDLGHMLTDQQVAMIGRVDVLFLPVGGQCVLEPTEAALVINQLSPHLVFPMHYKTPGIQFHGLASEPLESFLGRMDNIEHVGSMAVELDLARLPFRTQIMVLNYE